MFCSKCGNMLPDGAKFCSSCGAPQVGSTTRVNADCDHPHETATMVPTTGSVGFVDAIRLFFSRYADFSSRSRRSEYWYAALFVGLVNGLLSAVFHDNSVIVNLWHLVTLIPGIAVAVRRLHDAGKNGTFYLWVLVPLVGWFILLSRLCTDSVPANQWGPNPKAM